MPHLKSWFFLILAVAFVGCSSGLTESDVDKRVQTALAEYEGTLPEPLPTPTPVTIPLTPTAVAFQPRPTAISLPPTPTAIVLPPPPTTIAPTLSASMSDSERELVVVKTFAGSGSNATDSFTVTRSPWHLKWEVFTISGDDMIIYLNEPASGDRLTQIVNDTFSEPMTSTTSVFAQIGTYFLYVYGPPATIGGWEIEIFE